MTYREALETYKRASNPPKNDRKDTATVAADNMVIPHTDANNTNIAADKRTTPQSHACPQLSGTIFRIFVPEKTAFNFLNLIEVASPRGISLTVRLPLLSKLTTDGFKNTSLMGIIDAIRTAGGTVEVVS